MLFSGARSGAPLYDRKTRSKGNRSGLQEIEGALQTLDIVGHDMGVNLGALHIDMAKKILQHPVFTPYSSR